MCYIKETHGISTMIIFTLQVTFPFCSTFSEREEGLQVIYCAG